MKMFLLASLLTWCVGTTRVDVGTSRGVGCDGRRRVFVYGSLSENLTPNVFVPRLRDGLRGEGVTSVTRRSPQRVIAAGGGGGGRWTGVGARQPVQQCNRVRRVDRVPILTCSSYERATETTALGRCKRRRRTYYNTIRSVPIRALCSGFRPRPVRRENGRANEP